MTKIKANGRGQARQTQGFAEKERVLLAMLGNKSTNFLGRRFNLN